MKKAFRLLLCILVGLPSITMGQQTVSGKVVSSNTKECLPFASILLTNVKTDSTFGMPSELNGTFIFKKVPGGIYKLQLSVVGFDVTTISNIEVKDKSVKMGTISLSPSSIKLDEIQVVAERSYIENKAGKKVINVGSDIINSGGSAIEVLSMAPAVEVGVGGQISIRGESDVYVLINGRETALSYLEPSQALKHIPISSIEKIEIITNGGAEFGPDGEGGMINVIMKKEKEDGLKITIGTSANSSPASTSLSTGVEYQKSKLGLSMNYSLDSDGGSSKNAEVRNYRSIVEGNRALRSISRDKERGLYHFLIGGATHNFNDSTELGLNLFMESGESKGSAVQSLAIEKANGQTESGTFGSNSAGTELFGGLELNYSQKFKKEKEIVLEASIDKGSFDTNNRFNLSQTENTNQFKSANQSRFLSGSTALNFEMPLTYFMGINAGIESNFLKFDVKQEITDNNITSRRNYTFKQNKSALFVISKWNLGDLEFATGARAELYTSNGHQQGEQDFRQHFLNVYPNFQFSTYFGGSRVDQALMFSYSKRINRPDYMQLNPSINYGDPYNLSQGNPNLKPEFAHIFELTHEFSTPQFSLFTTLFNRITTNVIQENNSILPDNVLLTSYSNESNRINTGVELYLKYDIAGWWDISNDFTVYRKSFKDQTADTGFGNVVNWRNKIVSNFKPGNGLKLQLQMKYVGKQSSLFVSTEPYYTLNLGASKEMIKGKGKLNFSVTDIFNSTRFVSTISQTDFVARSTTKYNSRRFILGFSLSF